MKRLLLFLIIITSFQTASYASHTYGGEIGWNCLPNGKYQFYMSFFRDCTGIPWTFQEETIGIVGSPLPKDATGATISSILMKPDSVRWKDENDGDAAPKCTDQYGSPLRCADGNPKANGIIQEFFYLSSTITLGGTPPRNGWRFFWESACCRPGNLDNVFTNGANPRVLLRAEMLPTKNRDKVDPCIDSSPEFRGLPVSAICRDYEFTYNTTAIDRDLDSVTYDWERPIDPPAASPVGLAYKAGYAFNNPTPDKTFDIRNIPSTLNRTAGTVKMAIYSGSGVQKFLTVIRATSWRDGVQIARIFRELPLSVFDCKALPSGLVNKPPTILIDGEDASTVQIEAVAGQEVRRSIEIKDLDQTGVGTQLQVVTLVPDGLMFSKNRKDPLPCQIDNGLVDPCAVLNDTDPKLDITETPPVYKVQGLGGLSTEFIWQTDCRHVQTKTGVPGTRAGIYNFVMRVTDDHCPIPSINYPTISVRVVDPITLSEPIVKGVSVGLDGLATYQWAPPLDSAWTFHEYKVEVATVQNTFPTGFWGVLNANQRQYQYKAIDDAFSFYQPIGGIPANGPNLLKPITNFDWYLRMTTVSGCEDDAESAPSDQVRVIELEATPGGIFPAPTRAGADLNWNRPKPLNSPTHPYFLYESPTTYYIWENDSIINGGVGDTANWYIRGSTQNTTFNVPSNVCGEYVGFRIEARDTLIVWKHGHPSVNANSNPIDSVDHLTFSTFSTIDTIFVIDPGIVPEPRFDTIQVLSNGDVAVRINEADAGTTGEFRLYNGSVASGSVMDTLIRGEQDSTVIVGANATAGTAEQTVISGINSVIGTSKSYSMKAIDDCDPGRSTDGQTYSTISPHGGLSNTCPPTFTLNWNMPTGYATPYSIDFYKVYNKGRLVGVVTGATTTTIDIPVFRDSTYEFQVIAVDQNLFTNTEAVNISAVLDYATPTGLRTDEVVPGPDLRCSFVEQNGSVTLSFDRPLDSTDNGLGYEFDYRVSGSANWTLFPNSSLVDYDDSTVTITGINAQNQQYDFQARTLSGCSGTETGFIGNDIRSIFVTVTPTVGSIDKLGDVVWNDDAVSKVNPDSIFKYPVALFYQSDRLDVVTTGSPYVDNGNSAVCDETFNYHITRVVPTLTNHFSNGQGSCISRSNIDDANYRDTIDPAPEHFDYISFNLDNRELEGVWSGVNPGGVDTVIATTLGGINSGRQSYIEVSRADFIDRYLNVSNGVLDPRDSSVALGARSKDACGNIVPIDSVRFHRSIDINARWSICDSTIELDWNNYVGFGDGVPIYYQVYWSTTGFNEAAFDINDTSRVTQDTTFRHKIINGNQTYWYHVKASPDPTFQSTIVSNSNTDSDFAGFDAEPRYGEVTYVTVLPTEEIEIEYVKDTTVFVNGYTVYRGTNLNNLKPITFVDYTPIEKDETFRYTDADVDVNNSSYFYNVVIENDCRIPIDTSNIGKSIFLQIKPDNEALTNTLTWNRYEEWDSLTAYYNIYRGVDEEPSDQPYAVMAPTGRRTEIFIDDVYDDVFSIGKFCYRVEAVQGPVSDRITAGLPNTLSSATSSSNLARTTQKPLFYVPNAFAPDGVNKLFGPKGQFFDYSLFEMVIYNRWGEELYRTDDINKGWDGKHNGEIAQLGSYVYMIRFIDADGDEHRRKGTVTLLK